MAVPLIATPLTQLRPVVRDFGTCLDFDGSNDITTYGTANPFTGSFYIGFWMKWEGLNGNFQTLVSKRDSYGASGLMFSMSLNSTTGLLSVDSVTSFVPFNYLPILNKWTHICWVHDTTVGFTKEVLYVNGVQNSSQGMGTLGTGTGALISVGACEATPTDVFNGRLDEVAIGTVLPTATEVLNIARSSSYPVDSLWTLTKFDEGSGTIATDVSGGNHHGTINGATYATDKVIGNRATATLRVPVSGMSLQFDGIDDSVKYGTANPFTGSFYFASYVKWSGLNGNYQTLFAKRDSYGTAGIRFSMSATPTTGRINVDTITSFIPFNYPLVQDEWTHLCWVHDTATLRDLLYANGTLVSNQGLGSLGTAATALISVGACEGTPIDVFYGKIDEVAIGTTVPTTEEIVTMVTSSTYPTGSFWTNTKYNEGTASIAYDASGNGNRGTITGALYNADVPIYSPARSVV